MTDDSRTRRRFLSGAGVTATLLAGCTGPSGGSGDGGNRSEGDTAADTGTTDDGGSADHGGHALSGPSASATVRMATMDGGSHFEPHVAWVERGGTVTWELGSGAHTTTAYAGTDDRPRRIPEDASEWDSDTLSEPGATFEQTFETAGVYDYYCRPHESSGMLGTVIVGDPEPDDQPGLAPPGDDLPDAAAAKVESLNGRVAEVLGAGDGSGSSGGGSESDGTTTHGHDGTTTGDHH